MNSSQLYNRFLQIKTLLENYPLWKVKKMFDYTKDTITWFAILPMMREDIFSYLSNLKCAITVNFPCLRISLTYTNPMDKDKKEKVSLKVKLYNSTGIRSSGYIGVESYCDSSFDIIFLENEFKETSLFMTGRDSHYCPFSLRKMQSVYNKMDENLQSVFDKILFNTGAPFCDDLRKDLKNGLCGLSYDFEKIIKCHNKRELLSKIFKTEISSIPKSYNKFSIIKGYGLMLLSKYIVLEHIDLIKKLPDSFFQDFYKAAYIKGKVKSLLVKYYQDRFDTSDYKGTIEDFFNMSVKLKRKIPLKINSISKLIKLHDEYAGEILRKSIKGKEIKIHNKYTPLIKILSEKYTRYEIISKAERLALEGKIQHNCVYSYLKSIERGDCLICSIVDDGKRFTIEIRKTKTKFKVTQFLGINNTSPHGSILNIVKNDFITINKELTKKS